MSDTKWVQHFSRKGEKYKVTGEDHPDHVFWECEYARDHLFHLPKTEYNLCTPPERWEVVPLDSRLRLNKNARSFCIPTLFENERFAIKDGALVLERRVG